MELSYNYCINLNIYQFMWIDGIGLTHYGNPYDEKKFKEYRDAQRTKMTIEEKYQEKIEEVCKWLDIILYSDPYSTGSNIIVHPMAYKSKKEIIDDFREKMKIT